MRALIIVDIQNDFLPGGALAVPNGNEIIETINQIQEKFDLVVATQDWHPNTHKSFASQHQDKNLFEIIELHGLEQVLWPDHCIQGTEGAALNSALNSAKISAIFRKGTDYNIDSYSAFFDNGRKKSTGLNGYLKEHNITEVYVCGLAADYCVYFTAKDALELGYTTTILENATKPINVENFNTLKEEFTKDGGKISSYIL